MIDLQLDNAAALAVLDGLLARLDDTETPLREIGEDLTESTKRRFGTSTAPDGTAWAPNKQSTIDAYLGKFGGSFKKDGTVSKKGAARSAAKKPLIGETRTLSTTLHYVLSGDDSVAIGSALPYAAMANFGGKKSEFPQLWGDIPAREFLGLSAEDGTSIMATLEHHLLGD